MGYEPGPEGGYGGGVEGEEVPEVEGADEPGFGADGGLVFGGGWVHRCLLSGVDPGVPVFA